MRWADGLPGLGRNGPLLSLNRRENARGRLRPCTDGAFPCERSTDVDAGDVGAREHALHHEYKHYLNIVEAEGTAQSVADSTDAGRRRKPENCTGMTVTVCANGPERKRRPVSWTPGRRCELEPASGDGAEQRQLFMAE